MKELRTKRSLRIELEENTARLLMKALKTRRYKSFAEWVRERIREFLSK